MRTLPYRSQIQVVEVTPRISRWAERLIYGHIGRATQPLSRFLIGLASLKLLMSLMRMTPLLRDAPNE